ncbi:MAG: hypothetical protein ACR2K2_14800 [Mycobacteriales bacterium]
MLEAGPRALTRLRRTLGREQVAAALVVLGDAVVIEGDLLALAVEEVARSAEVGRPVEEVASSIEVVEDEAATAGAAPPVEVVQCRTVARRHERRELARVARRAARRSRRVRTQAAGRP